MKSLVILHSYQRICTLDTTGTTAPTAANFVEQYWGEDIFGKSLLAKLSVRTVRVRITKVFPVHWP